MQKAQGLNKIPGKDKVSNEICHIWTQILICFCLLLVIFNIRSQKIQPIYLQTAPKMPKPWCGQEILSR